MPAQFKLFEDVLDPRPGIKVIAIGNSLDEHNNFSSSTFGNWARGPMTWAKTLDPRIRFDVWPDAADPYGRGFTGANFGVGGTDIDSIMSRLDAAIARRPDVIKIEGGTNNMLLSGAIGGADYVAGVLKAMVDRVRAASIRPLVEGISVRGLSSWGAGVDARYKYVNVNRQLREYCASKRGAVFFDPNDVWASKASAVGSAIPNAGYVIASDDTHRTVQGAYYVGKQLLTILQSMMPAGNGAPLVSPDDVYEATKNPYGCMTSATYTSSNPFLTGSVAVADTGGSGNKATGTFLERSSGTGTVAGSKNADGSQRIVATPGASGTDLFLFRFGDFAHGLPVGTWVRAVAKVSVAAWSGWKGISLLCRDTGAGGPQSYGLQYHDPANDDTGLFPQEAWSGWIQTEPFQIVNTGNLRVRIELRTKGGAAGTGTIDVSAMAAQVVPDPRPFWGY